MSGRVSLVVSEKTMKLLDSKHPDFETLRREILMRQGGLLSPGHCDYYQAYFEHFFEDCSFALVRGDSRMLLLVTRHWSQGRAVYSWYGRPVQLIDELIPQDRAQSEGLAIKQVQQLLTPGCEFDYQAMTSAIDWLSKLLLSMGVAPSSVIEQKIPLHSNEQLLESCRKVYRQNFRWGMQNLACRIIDSHNVTPTDFEKFEAFHIAVAGRRTRSAASWLAQLELTKHGENFLILTEYEERLVGASLFAAVGLQAYYSVGVYDRDLFHMPISHYPVWLGLLHARELGCKVMDMGESYYAGVPDSTGRVPDEKECQISHFKRGFGGELIMGLRFRFHSPLAV